MLICPEQAKRQLLIMIQIKNIQMTKFKIVIWSIAILLFGVQSIMAQCEGDSHSTNGKDSWLSCQTSAFPNGSESTNYHWISYDLGYHYTLGIVKIWNYNVLNQTGNGIKDGEIFYSEDGQNWLSSGIFQIPEASGQHNYKGWEGIDLNGITARFITIMAYSNWGNGNCTGLSEVRFNISEQTTSVEGNITMSSDLLVFPNPTNQVLSINLKNNQLIKELIILDNAGHEILRRTDLNAPFTVDVNTFLAGMYYVKVLTTNQEYLITKFVKISL